MVRRNSDTSDEQPATTDALLREIARTDTTSQSLPVPMVGARIGRFVIHEQLGRGGMGVVYRAYDEGLERMVALKLLPASRGDDPARRARFLREARAAAAVTHPNIVTVYDVGEAEGRIFIAMERIAGRSLRDLLRAGPLPIPTSLALARGILRGIAKAHAAGIVHRDLKPDNVMVGDDDEAKVLDFGLAKTLEPDVPASPAATGAARGPQTDGEMLLGTPGYLSPEQALGRAVDVRTDVFSFGVMLCEMLTGERPIGVGGVRDLVEARGNGATVRLDAYGRGVPEALAQIVAKCTAWAPADRFASAREVLEAVDGAASTGTRPARRIARIVASTVAVVLAATAAAMALRPGPTRVAGVPATAASIREGAAITAHAAPRTDSAAAAAAYAAGLQQLREASLASAYDDLLRAVSIEPTLAAAHLRLALYGTATTLADRRAHFAEAARFRSALDSRDAALLRVAEAYTWDTADGKEAVARLEAALVDFPDDAEIRDLLGAALVDMGRVADGRAQMRRAAELDPEYAGTRWRLAKSYADLDETDDALRVLGECLRVAPAAGSCLRIRAVIEMEHGRCAELEADARRLMAVDPKGRRSHEFLALALAARGAPTESVRTALDAMIAAGAGVRGHAPQAAADLGVALLDGDFRKAEAAARALDSGATEERSERVHSANTMALLDVYEETGESALAFAAAEGFERKLPAWTLDAPWGVRLYLLHARHQLGRTDDAHFRASRDALLTELHALTPAMADSIAPYIYAAHARTPSEAADVIRYLADHPTKLKVGYSGFGLMGEAFLRAGQPDDALPLLRGAATACTVLPRLDDVAFRAPFFNVRANLLLGEALEARGDLPGACAAYATVVARWGRAKPRSVSAERATMRRDALRCDPLP